MSQFWMRYLLAGVALFPTITVSRAQSTATHDAWLMQNYRFTGPPPPGEVKPTAPVSTELRAIQRTVRTILGRANFDGDYETALAAAAQAVANAQLIGAVTEHEQATQAAQAAKSATEQGQSPASFFLIALKDKSINAARLYWVDGPMLNYVTLEGVHIIVRLDLVDRGLSRDLNRQRIADFRLPE
jgi:hypothetical protein